jgi:fructosamine-3-kinase
MLTAAFLRHLETRLGSELRKKVHVKRVLPVSGGSINLTAKIDTSAGTFFLKTNDSFRYPKMFEKEAKGLDELNKHQLFTIPKVLFTGEEDGHAYILMEFIEARGRKNNFWEIFGSSLAKLHKQGSFRYGYDEDNYIGSLVQSNKEHKKWTSFFIEERLEKQLKLAMQSGKMNKSDESLFQKFYMKYESMVTDEPPSLLHGDLWSGNFIVGRDGEPCLIDPAVYFGNREVDLAMTKLFGGFDMIFYKSYNDEYPLAPGYEERVEMHNVYPLMVHLNLFGGGYADQVRAIIK